MLTPDQVLPFLTHEVHYVRAHAAGYLMDVGAGAPTATAMEVWRGIDLYGKVEGEGYEYPDSTFYLDTLATLPQNEESVRRLISATQKWKKDGDDEYYSAQTLLAKMPLHLIDAHLNDVFALIGPDYRKILDHRLRLRTMSPEALWTQLVETCQKLDTVYDADVWAGRSKRFESMHSEAHRIVVALAEHGEFAVPNALPELQNLDDPTYLQSFCLELLGMIRCAAALDICVACVKHDEDVLNTPAEIALQRLDPLLVVPRLEEAFKNDDPFVRMRIAELLGKIKHPDAEAALLRLYPSEVDGEALGFIANALTDLCSAEAIGTLRQGVLDDLYISSFHDIKNSLLATMVMVGREAGEIQSFEDEIGQTEERRRIEDIERLRLLHAKHAQERELREASVKQEAPPPPQIAKPIRRDEPKVGRNDPCPCGSGKKYKKCCGK